MMMKTPGKKPQEYSAATGPLERAGTRFASRLSGRTWRWILAFLFIVANIMLPLLLKPILGDHFIRVSHVIVLIGIYAIAALGLNIIVGYCGLLNLGFAGFMLIGSYTCGILMKEHGFTFWQACLAAAAHGAIWGILLGIPTLRLTGDYFAIVTFGFSELVLMVCRNWVSLTRGPRGYPDIPPPRIDFGWLTALGIPRERVVFDLTKMSLTAYWYIVAGVLGICLIIVSRLSRSRLGRAWRALREDEVAAEACGINAQWYKTIAFAISAALGALSGAMAAGYSQFADLRYYEFMTSVYVLCYIVLGGMGTIVGPLLGTAVLVAMGELLREHPAGYFAPLFGWAPAVQTWLRELPWIPDMRYLFFGLVLILMIRFRPEGLLASQSRARELHGHYAFGSEDESSLYVLQHRE